MSIPEPPPFRLTPSRPLDELLAEARATSPPAEAGRFRVSDLVDLSALSPAPRQDLRYATTNNFLGTAVYASSRAYLQRPAAAALLRVERDLRAQGMGLVVYDAYRPWHVTKVFWEATPDELRTFVANPAKGSRHNRGCAVDVGLIDRATGAELPMPSAYDEFSERAYADFSGGTEAARHHRRILRTAMETHGYVVYEAEWWHFDYCDWADYSILNLSFEEVALGTTRALRVAS